MDTVNEVNVNYAIKHSQCFLAHENEEMKASVNVVNNVHRLKRSKKHMNF